MTSICKHAHCLESLVNYTCNIMLGLIKSICYQSLTIRSAVACKIISQTQNLNKCVCLCVFGKGGVGGELGRNQC